MEVDAMASSDKVAEPEVDAIAGSIVEIPVPVAMELDAMPTSDDPVVMDVVEAFDRMAIVVALEKRKRDLEDAFVNASLVRNLKRRKLCQDPVPVVDSVNMELDEDKASLDDPVDMGVDAMLSSVHAMPSSKKSCSPRLLRTRPYLERKCKVVVCLRMRPYFARQCKKNVRVLVV
jgi:hypothetical protein